MKQTMSSVKDYESVCVTFSALKTEGRVIKEAEENFSVMVPQERFEDEEELLRILKEFVPLMARLRVYDGGSAELVSWYVRGTDEEANHA